MTLRELLKKATGGEWYDIAHPKYKSASHRIATRADEPWENFNQIGYVGKNDAALIVALHNCLPELLAVRECAEKRPNKFDLHYMIWMDQMDAALQRLKEKEEEI